MKWIFSFLLALMAMFSSVTLIAQDERTLEFIRQEEQRRKTALLRELDSGVFFMDHGEYQLADQKFRLVLENIRSVPSDLAFYFGKNSYFLENPRQSIDWLNKYIALKGTNGQYYAEAVDYLKKAEASLLKVRSQESKKAEEILSNNYDIDCGSGKVTCPVCKGDHVITRRNAFGGTEYKTCPYCNEHGMLTCDEYNQLLRGELKKKG